MAPVAIHRLLSELPLPLAQLGRRAINARPGRDRHDSAFYLAEASLKLIASARIGCWLEMACDPESDLAKKLETLVLPPLGHWYRYLRDVSDALSQRFGSSDHPLASSCAQLAAAGTDGHALSAFTQAAREEGIVSAHIAKQASRQGPIGFFEMLVSYRNETIGHGAQRRSSFYERFGTLLLDASAEVLAMPEWFGGLRLAVATLDVATSKRATTLAWKQLMGLSPLPLDETADGAKPEQLYLIGEGLRVPLHPLVVFQESDTAGERFGFLNRAIERKRKSKGAAPALDVRRVDYLDYQSGETLADVDAREGLAILLTKLRGAPVDVATVTTLATSMAGDGDDEGPSVLAGESDPNGASAADPRDVRPGSRLGHYEIVREVGRGGMGRVYVARDTKLGREVALKLLPPELANHAQSSSRFVREARAAAALSHPNIVTLHSVEETDGHRFITMELVEGELLSERIPSEGFDVSELVRIACDLADAVAAAHEQGILHRDLKPQNVILTPDGTVKILDFGLAKRLERATARQATDTEAAAPATQEGQILGTPAYMSPEQAEGRPVDHRSDIFSLGALLYELASGRRAFAGRSPMSILSAVLKDDPPHLAELRAALPSRLVRIIHRCLHKELRRRYQSARDLASDLDELRHEGRVPTVGAAAPDVRPSASPARRWWLGALAVAAVAGALGYYSRGVAPPAERSEAQPPASVRSAAHAATAPPFKRFVRLTTTYGAELGPDLAPDGRWFVYAAGPPDNLDIYRQRVGGENRTNLTADSPVRDWQPAIAPTGEYVAFRSERDGGGIYVMGATGESVRRVTETGFHPAWSPDGKFLIVSSQAVINPRSRGTLSTAWLVELESGRKEQLEAGRDAAQGSWSADGRWLVMHGNLDVDHAGLLAVPRRGGEVRLLLDRGNHMVWTPRWAPDGRHVYYAGNASGVMNIWRLPVDPTTATPSGPPTQLTTAVAAAVQYPSLSRDGKRLAFSVTSRSGNIAKVRFDATRGIAEGPPIMVTRGPNGFSCPDVSPDGAWLAFCACYVRSDTEENIYLSRADGSGLKALTHDEGHRNRLPRWTSDGRRILFYSNRSGSWEVWSVAPDGSGLRQVTDTPGKVMLFAIPERAGSRVVAWVNMLGMLSFDRNKAFSEQSVETIPAFPEPGHQFVPTDWSPDGDLLAGHVGSHGRSVGVHTRSFATGEYRKVTDTGESPRWLADGKRLIFTENNGQGLSIVHAAQREPRALLSMPDAIVGDSALSRDEQWLYFSTVSEDGDVWLAER